MAANKLRLVINVQLHFRMGVPHVIRQIEFYLFTALCCLPHTMNDGKHRFAIIHEHLPVQGQ